MPIVVMTGHVELDQKERLGALGVNTVLTKPFTVGSIDRSVEDAGLIIFFAYPYNGIHSLSLDAVYMYPVAPSGLTGAVLCQWM